jgi:drug/metabolite transporter (DMT)-like permease
MTKSLMPGLVYFSGCLIGTERLKVSILFDMVLIAFGVVVCAFGEHQLHIRGLVAQLAALLFEATRLTLVQVLHSTFSMCKCFIGSKHIRE